MVNDEQRGWRQKTGLHTNMFGPGAELRGPAKAWKKSGGLVKTSSSSSSRSARVFNRSGGRRGELLLSWWEMKPEEEEEEGRGVKKKKKEGKLVRQRWREGSYCRLITDQFNITEDTREKQWNNSELITLSLETFSLTCFLSNWKQVQSEQWDTDLIRSGPDSAHPVRPVSSAHFSSSALHTGCCHMTFSITANY